MGLLVARVRFESGLPSLDAMRDAISVRTGLRCVITKESDTFLTIRCRGIPSVVEASLSASSIELEQMISQPVYLFDEVKEALVDLGGCRMSFRDGAEPDGTTKEAAIPFRDRPIGVRMLVKHPIVAGFLWIGASLFGARKPR